MTRAGRRAFTLIELLVVIAIIAVLIGLTLPARERASADVFGRKQHEENSGESAHEVPKLS